MGELRTDVLYAVDLFTEGQPWPVRVLDTRRWSSTSSRDRSGFVWRLNNAGDAPSSSLDTNHGVACLYWSPTDPEPDGAALLDYPWEPLPEDPEEAGAELTRRAKEFGPGHSSVWLCLRPIPRRRISTRWLEPSQREAWEQASARLTALGLGSVQYGGPGDHAPISLAQLTALLDRAEQA
ncbi:hypothetical protein [Streptomyces sp. NPDC029554]|uniref:hypothetical protein n=1 Tax=Streptomyces sp. NPDC029554 TaxID=3155126 RepID=UPI00340A7A96